MNKVRFHSMLYTEAKKRHKLPALALWIRICQVYPKKQLIILKNKSKTSQINQISNKLGVSSATFYSKLGELIKLGFVFETENGYRLINKNEQKERFKGYYKVLYIEDNIDTYKTIKEFLKTFVIVSNLYSQDRKIKKLQNLGIIKHKLEKGKKARLTKREFKIAKKHKFFKDFNINENLTLARKSINILTNTLCVRTATRYKKIMKRLKLVDYENTVTKLYDDISKEDYFTMRKYGDIPFYAIYSNQYKSCYVFNATIFRFCVSVV